MKESISSLKKKAWSVFSLWVRNRGARNGFNSCVTCGAWKDVRTLVSGHFIHGHSKASFMSEDNVHPQCVACNSFLGGKPKEYEDFMLTAYGEAGVEMVRALSHQIWKPSRTELEALIEKYKQGAI